MALLIDGYNLLHASGILARGVGPGTLERARAALLNFLAESLEPEQIRRTVVVFDARAAPPGLPRVVDHRGLSVHYAPNPGDADEWIESLILADTSPRQLIVVSGDHRLQRAARRRRATAVDSDVWYAEVVRLRITRQEQVPAADVPKPAGPLGEFEVAYWLRKFGMEPDAALTARETAAAAEARAGDATRAALEAAAGNADVQDADAQPDGVRHDRGRQGRGRHDRGRRDRGQQDPGRHDRGASLDNPFPPGYGEDLLEDE